MKFIFPKLKSKDYPLFDFSSLIMYALAKLNILARCSRAIGSLKGMQTGEFPVQSRLL